MNIVSLLNQIDSREIVLPAIQRDFVWSESRITKLMDSIMRGYSYSIFDLAIALVVIGTIISSLRHAGRIFLHASVHDGVIPEECVIRGSVTWVRWSMSRRRDRCRLT